MSSSSESDAEEEISNHRELDSVITKVRAKSNYKKAGEFIEEDKDQISMSKYGHLVKPANESIFNKVVSKLDLPYNLAEFQIISVHCLLQKKNVILVSPTGSGKMNVLYFGILGLREVSDNMKGVAIVTQPLSSIMNEKMKNSLVKTAVLTMAGKLKNSEEDVELSCLEDDIFNGLYPVVIGHPESWGSKRGQHLLMEMKKRNMILLVGIDEFHQSHAGHWQGFRPEMQKVIGRLRIFVSPGAPCIAMSATATKSEISGTIANLQFLEPPIVLQSCPVQGNMKFVSLQRPSNSCGSDGFEDSKGVWHPGYLTLLKRLYLREFINCIKSGRKPKRGIIFCRTDIQLLMIFNFLRENLPVFKDVTKSPFVMMNSSVAPLTEKRINERDDISLFISTSKMLMGVDVPGISVIIFLRPLNMVHYLVQGGGRGGRRMGTTSGVRQKVIVYVLWNKSDLASNVEGMSSDVREFCVEEGCLKKFLRLYFAGSQEEVESLASEWCCGNCDL